MAVAGATQRRGPFSYENALLLILGSSWGFAFFDRQSITFLTPFIVGDLHLNNTEVGALSSVLSLTWALSAFAIAAWSDATGVRKPFLAAAILVFSFCSVLSGLAGSFVVLLLARGLMGVVEGPFLPVCLSIMLPESSPRRRGLNAGVMQNVFSAILLFLAPFVLVWLAQAYGWRSAFFISAAPGFLLLLLVLKFVREPARPPREAAAEAVAKPGFLALLRNRNVLLCCLISCCMVGWTVQLATFMPLYFVQFRHVSPNAMATMMSALGVSTGISGPLVSSLSDRFGRKPVVVLFCLVGLIVPFGVLTYSGSLLLTAAMILVGWLGSGTFSLFMGAIPSESSDRRTAATAMGLVVCVGELVGGFAAPLAAGRIADLTSLQAPILLSGVLALAGAGLALMLKETAPSRVGAATA